MKSQISKIAKKYKALLYNAKVLWLIDTYRDLTPDQVTLSWAGCSRNPILEQWLKDFVGKLQQPLGVTRSLTI